MGWRWSGVTRMLWVAAGMLVHVKLATRLHNPRAEEVQSALYTNNTNMKHVCSAPLRGAITLRFDALEDVVQPLCRCHVVAVEQAENRQADLGCDGWGWGDME